MKHYYHYYVTITTYYTKRKKNVFDFIGSEGILIAENYDDAMGYLLDRFSYMEDRANRTIEMNELPKGQTSKGSLEIFDVIGWNLEMEQWEAEN